MKKEWKSPVVTELSVGQTLGGQFTNFTEQDFGQPHDVPLGIS